MRLIDESLSLNPNNHRARLVVAGIAMDAEDFPRVMRECCAIYDRTTQEDRRQMGDAVLYLMLAHAAKMLGELEDAIRFASEAAGLYPRDPHPPMILGELYEIAGDNDQAERQCKKALVVHDERGCEKQLTPQSVYLTLTCLGGSLARQEKYVEAECFLKEAMKLGYARQCSRATKHR